MTDATRAELVPAVTANTARKAALAFLAGYGERTREAYELDLRQWLEFCQHNGLDPLEARRPHIELWGRHLESLGRATSTVGRRLSTICCWYRYLAEEDWIVKDPAAHVRRPAVPSESTTLGLDRNEMGALLYTAAAAPPFEYALVALLCLNGLRVSEALNADIADMGMQRGHRTIAIVGKGNKPALIPLAPRTCRAVDLAIGERTSGPIILDTRGQRMNRHSAQWVLKKLGRRAGIAGHLHPHMCRHSFITAALDAGVPLRDVQIAARHADPRATTRYDRGRENLDRHATYVVAAFLAGAA